MKQIFKYYLLTASAVIITLQSCTTAVIEEGNTTPILDPVTYNSDIKTIMTNNCITCHGGPAPSDGLSLTTFEEVKAAVQQRNLNERINNPSNPMPQAGLMIPENRQKIQKWIDNNFPEN